MSDHAACSGKLQRNRQYVHLARNRRDRTIGESLRAEAGGWLKRRREEVGGTQLFVAQAVGFSNYRYISQIEAGKGRVPPEKYAAWAQAIHVEPDELCKRLLQFYDPFLWTMLYPHEKPHPVALHYMSLARVLRAKRDPAST